MTTTKKAKATKRPNAKLVQLAKDVAAVMTNPALPSHLHNAIGQALTDIENEAYVFGDSETDDIIRWLPLAIEKLQAQDHWDLPKTA